MKKLRAAELCSGYNGLGMAVEHVFGAEPAWFSEYEAAPSRILAHHYPDVPNHGDMTKIDWANVEPVDIISGGTPCQDLSAAGKRKGMNEGTRSNLWVQMREAIAIIKPTYVVWENVRGAYSAGAYSEMEQQEGRVGEGADPHLRALGRVLGDLSDLGYDCQWRGLRAADVGAPHGRFRVFVLATRQEPTHTLSEGLQGPHDSARTTQARRGGHTVQGASSDAADTISEHRGQRRDTAPSETAGGWTSAVDSGRGGIPALADADCGNDDGWLENALRGSLGGDVTAGYSGVNWGEYEPAIRRWEQVMGRRAPAPTEPTGRNGAHRLSARFCEWMMGVPNGWICDVPGVSRNEALKAAGNGVVPQQAIAALQDMLRVP